jgi:hypothetical protein
MLKKKLNIDINNPDARSLTQQLVRFIMGKEKPSFIVRSLFFTHLIGASIFFFWYISAFFSIHFLENITSARKLRRILNEKGSELGIADFRNEFETFTFVMIALWFVYFIGLIFLWRNKKLYRFLLLGVLLSYPILTIIFLNLKYLLYETSLFDGVVYLYLLISIVVYTIWGREKNVGNIEHNPL